MGGGRCRPSVAMTMRRQRDGPAVAPPFIFTGYKLFHARHAGSIFPAQFGPGSNPKISVSGSRGKDFASYESYQKVNPDWSI